MTRLAVDLLLTSGIGQVGRGGGRRQVSQRSGAGGAAGEGGERKLRHFYQGRGARAAQGDMKPLLGTKLLSTTGEFGSPPMTRARHGR
eukprot:1035782-Prorocentrum_minimum.AAC.1